MSPNIKNTTPATRPAALALPLVIVTLTLMTVLSSCGTSSRRGGDGRDTVSLTRMACDLHEKGAPVDTLIALQRRAVDELRRGTSPDDAVSVLEQMGLFYYVADSLDRAMKYYIEAADSLAVMPLSERNTGTIKLFGDLSLLCQRLGIIDEAFQWNDSAVAEGKRQGGAMLSDVYRFRAGLSDEAGDTLGAFRCYDLAAAAARANASDDDRAELEAIVGSERAYYMLQIYPDRPDSVRRAKALLERAVACNPDNRDLSYETVSLGEAYILTGETDRGLAMIEKAAASASRQHDVELLNFANTLLVRYYSKLKLWDRLGRIFPEYHALNDSFNSVRRREAVIGAKVRYDNLNRGRENEMLRLSLEASHEHTLLIASLTALIALVSIIIIIAGLRSYRRLKSDGQRDREELESLSSRHTRALNHIRVMEQDLSAARNSNNELLTSVQLITPGKQGAFRRAFSALYPNVIPRIRERVPSITPNDELLCMLIYLKHSTEEISVCLGISRASVNSARYRLRQKFGLSKSDDLDKFLADF